MNFPTYYGSGEIAVWADQLRIYCGELSKSNAELLAAVGAMSDEIQSLKTRINSLEEQIISANLPSSITTVSTNVTLDVSDLGKMHVFNATTAITLNLPQPLEGTFIKIHNVGTGRISIVEPVNSWVLANLDTDQGCEIRTTITSALAPTYPQRVLVTGTNGNLYVSSQIVVDNDVSHTIIKDSTGNFWKLNISDSGAFNSTSVGTTRPTDRDSDSSDLDI